MKRISALALIAVCTATSAMAQDGQIFSDDLIMMQGDHMTSIGITNLNNSIVDRKVRERAAARQGQATPAPNRFSGAPGGLQLDLSGDAGKGGIAAPTSASYRFDPAVRRKLADTMAQAAGAERAAEMREVVASGRAVREYERAGPALGLRRNDAIDGLVFYLLAQWGVANDYREMFTRAEVEGVRRQAAAAYAGIADKLGTDALRQEFGETLMVQGAILSGVHETAVRDGRDADARRFAAIAREGGVKVFTVDPTTIALTDNGFRRR